MRVVCISDTHDRHEQLTLPAGDVLVHAGDITMSGDLESLERFNDWLASLPHRHKVVIAGNHDFCFERQPTEARRLLTAGTYLEDSGVEIDGMRIWGSPWQPWFYDWAFNLARSGSGLAEKWALIPDDTRILLTHGPPLGKGDLTVRGEPVGCELLAERLETLSPDLHVFGHIHEGYGQWTDRGVAVNACVCTVSYEPTNPPVVVDLD